MIVSSTSYLLQEFSGWPSSKQLRSFSLSMQQPIPINPRMGSRKLSNPFGCSPSGVFYQNLIHPTPSYHLRLSSIINLHMKSMNQNHSLPQVMKKSIKALIVLLPLIWKQVFLFNNNYNCIWFFFSSCIVNFHLNILVILDAFWMISVVWVYPLQKLFNLSHIFFFGLHSRTWFLFIIKWVPFITQHMTYKWICTFPIFNRQIHSVVEHICKEWIHYTIVGKEVQVAGWVHSCWLISFWCLFPESDPSNRF